MKTIYMRWLVALIAAILLVLFLVSKINSCTETQIHGKENVAEISVLRAYLNDSTQTSTRAANTAYRDSVVAVESKKTELAKQDGQKHKARGDFYEKVYGLQKTKADSLVREYRKDTTAQSVKCNEAIAALQTANETLAADNKELDAENESLDIECEGYSKQLYQAREQRKDDTASINTQKQLISAQNNEIEVYKKSQNKAENGFKKAEKWVFGVAGAVITFLIMK